MQSSRCKNCGSELKFNPSTQSLKCESCGGLTEISKSKSSVKHAYGVHSEAKENKENNTQYKCDSCGISHAWSGNDELTRCPSCASTNIKKIQKFSFMPDGVVPFKISKDQARNMFISWVKKRKFAPNELKKLFQLGKLSGLYFPVWTFDFDIKTAYSGTSETTLTSSDGKITTKKRRFSGSRENSFKDLHESASSYIKTLHFKNLGDFGLNNNLYVYRPEFLFGFSSAQKDTRLQQAFALARESAADKIESQIRNSESGSIVELNFKSTFRNQFYRLCLFPIWATYFKYKGKKYDCFLNANDGSISGRAPKSFWKIFGLISGIISVVALIGILIALL